MSKEEEKAERIQQLDALFQERKNSALAQIIKYIVHHTKLAANDRPEYVHKVSSLTHIPFDEVFKLINSAKEFAYSVEVDLERSKFQEQLLKYLQAQELLSTEQNNPRVTKSDVFSLIAIYYFNKREVENAQPLPSSR